MCKSNYRIANYNIYYRSRVLTQDWPHAGIATVVDEMLYQYLVICDQSS